MTTQNYIFSIGIDKYSSEHWKNLNNAVYDAKSLTETLISNYSFEELPNNLYDENATKSAIFSSFSTLNNIITENDNLVVFFAGHGNMDPNTKKGFWIPSDANLDRSTWIENSSIKNFLSDCPAKHILLIIDSCFSGTFLTTTRTANLERTYFELSSKKSRWVISSGKEEKVSDGVPNEHSPFFKLVFKFLTLNDNEQFSVSELYNYIQLLISSSNNQKPQFNYIDNIGHEDGEFIFTLCNNAKFKIKKTIGIPNSKILKEEYLANVSKENKLASGKEVLIVKSILDDNELMIVENFRFDDDNNKKISFKDNFGIIDEKRPELNWKVIRRFATISGVLNYLEHNQDLINEKTVLIRAHRDIETVEDNPYCVYYSQYLTQLLNNNSKKMNCLHCGEKITDNNSYLIEFDEIGYDTAVGNVHKDCLRPIDRILGKSLYENLNESNYLNNFYFEKWLHLIENGQGQLVSLFKNKILEQVNVLSWNPENNINNGKYCIKITFDNGDTNFIMLGKQIQRFTDNEIDNWVKKFNKSIIEAKPCKIVESGINGYGELLQKIIEPNQTISYVISYEKTRYTKQFETNDISIINDYTPLCYLTNENDELIEIENFIPLISNPELIEKYIDNWKKSKLHINAFKVKIIESDLELGNLISINYPKNKLFAINPLFDEKTNKLKAGLIIKTIDQIIDSSPQNQIAYKKGDKVNIMINPSVPKLPLGILLEDEFIDETGENCVIFSPIEEGKTLELMYKLPTKIIKRI